VEALESLAPIAALRASRWAYPAVAAGHVLGIALLVGAILPLDLRALGFWRDAPEAALRRVLAPTAAAGLALAAISGAALFAVRASEYAENPAFLLKVSLVAAGVANALLLARRAGRLAAAVSAVVWLAALAAGRMIAYV
jgi:hypothetical protein